MLTDAPIRTQQIIPMRGKVLIRRAKRPEKTAGGIVLPEKTQAISQLGEIVATGDDVDNVRCGDLVVFSIYGSVTFPMIASSDLSEDLVVARAADILAIVSPEA